MNAIFGSLLTLTLFTAACAAQDVGRSDILSHEFCKKYGISIYQLITQPPIARELDFSESDQKRVGEHVADFVADLDAVYSVGINAFRESQGFDHTTPRAIVDERGKKLGEKASSYNNLCLSFCVFCVFLLFLYQPGIQPGACREGQIELTPD